MTGPQQAMHRGKSAEASAPASLAPWAPRFGELGLALVEPRVAASASLRRRGGVELQVEDGVLRSSTLRATMAVAAAAGMDAHMEVAVSAGLGAGRGLGARAATIAAVATAVNEALGAPLRKREVASACLDLGIANPGQLAAALLGGAVLVRRTRPVDLVRLPIVANLAVVSVTYRAADRADVALSAGEAADLMAFLSACHTGDLSLMARSLTPRSTESGHLGATILDVALDQGALGGTVNRGSAFILCRSVQSASTVAAAVRGVPDLPGDALVIEAAADNPGARGSR